MNCYDCSVAERLLGMTTVQRNDTVIRISPYVHQPSPPRVFTTTTPRPREAWPALTSSADCNARGSQSLAPLRQPVAPPRRVKTLPKTLGQQRIAQYVRCQVERPKAYPSPTIIVRGRSPPRQKQFTDADITPEIQRLQEETIDIRWPPRRLDAEDLTARSVDDSERRDEDVRVNEQLQRNLNTTLLLCRKESTRTPLMGTVFDDSESMVIVPVTASCKPLVTKLNSVKTAPAMSDDGDVSATTDQTQEEVPLPEVSDEKLKLLEKLVASGHLALGGVKVRVEVREKRLRISGNVDQIQTAIQQALETLTGICCVRADVSEKQLHLLLSDRGQRWLDDLLAQNGKPVIVLYAKDATGYLAAVDDVVTSQVNSALKKSLATDRISFGAELHGFLQSKQWTDVVEKYTSTRFLCVTHDDKAGKIVLDGCVRAVKDVGAEVRQLLRQNSRANRKIQLKPGEYRLVKQHQESEIYQCLKNQQG